MATTPARIPLNLLGIPFGLAGLGVTWFTMAKFGQAPDAVADVLFALSALAWVAVVVAYLRYLSADWTALRRDLTDPVAAPFASLAVIVPMLLAADGLYPHAAAAGRVLLDVFLVLTVLAGAWSRRRPRIQPCRPRPPGNPAPHPRPVPGAGASCCYQPAASARSPAIRLPVAASGM